MQLPQSYDQLIDVAQKRKLYTGLINQLNKDLNLAGIDRPLSVSLEPLELLNKTKGILTDLMKTDFSAYLNLLYIIDVSEAKIKRISEVEVEKIADQMVFLVLQREWQKVWLKETLS